MLAAHRGGARPARGLVVMMLLAAALTLVTATPAAAITCTATSTATLNTHLANPACDTIDVAAGTYAGPFSVTHSVLLRGANVGINPNSGTRGAESVVTSGGDGFSLDAAGIDVTINGFRIEPAAFVVRQRAVSSSVDIADNITENGNGIALTGTQVSATVADNRIVSSAAAIQIQSAPGTVSVTGNVLDGTGSTAVTLSGVGTSSVSGNQLVNTGGSGVVVASATGATTIVNNALGVIGSFGIVSASVVQSTISGNTMTSATTGGIVVTTATGETTILNNSLGTIGGFGITAASVTRSTISGNTMTSATGGGVVVSSASDETTVSSNALGSVGSTGVVVTAAVTNTVSGNTMTGAPNGGVVVASVAGFTTVANNILGDVGNTGIVAATVNGVTISANTLTSAPNGGVVVASAANTTITGNSLGRVGNTGIIAAGVANPTITGNSMISATVNGVLVAGSTGEATIGSNSLGILGVTGILASGIDRATISGNSMTSSGVDGILVAGASGVSAVTNNSMGSVGSRGVLVSGVATATISGNTVPQSGSDGIFLVSVPGSATIAGNTIGTVGVGSAGGNGIFMVAVGGLATISGNTIGNAPTGSGIFAVQLPQASITGNRIDAAITDGITAAGITGTISNNSVANANSTRNPDMGAITVDRVGGPSGPITLQSNAVVNSYVGLNLVATDGGVTANFNRIVDNQGAGIRNRSNRPDVIDAENNWFGCNEGPGQPGCDSLSETVTGTIDADPWLILGIGASAPSTFTTQAYTTAVTVTADLTKNSDGEDTSALGHILDGTPVLFATDLGAVNPANTTTTNGLASTQLTSPTAGTANVSATVDHETVTTPVLIEKSPPGSLTYYFAEGTTLDGFREYLLLSNAGINPASVTVTYFFDDGSTPQVTTVDVPAGGRTTIDVVEVVGVGRTGVSIGISSDWPIVAERSIFFERGFTVGMVNGSHSVLGARLPETTWSFAEGTTLDGFQEYLTLQNPGTVDAVVTIDYGLEDGGFDQTVIDVPAGQRRTVDVNAELGSGVVGHSTRVTSDQPILAERPMYFLRAVSDDGAIINGGHVSFGSAPSAEWNFAEGNVLPDFANYLTLGNPDTANAADATITYFFSDGTTAVRSATVAPGSRRTVKVFDATDPAGVGRNVSDPVSRGVSTKVTTAAPGGLVVERPMYFHRSIESPGPEINDGHDKPGARALAPVWSFAEGSTLPGFYPFLTILNPNPTAATIQLTYTPDVGAPLVRTVTAGATSRLTVQVYGGVDQGGIGGEVTGFGIVVAADQPVLAERPFYVNRQLPALPVINGGSVVIGFPTN